jgi:hypothetical protein
MDTTRKSEILRAEEGFHLRSLLAARLAEAGYYLIGPLPAPSDLTEEARTILREDSTSAVMLHHAEATRRPAAAGQLQILRPPSVEPAEAEGAADGTADGPRG